LNSLKTLLLERFRCPASELPEFGITGNPGEAKGFFRFGPDAVCFGRVAGETRPTLKGDLFDAANATMAGERSIFLPFHPKEIADCWRNQAPGASITEFDLSCRILFEGACRKSI